MINYLGRGVKIKRSVGRWTPGHAGNATRSIAQPAVERFQKAESRASCGCKAQTNHLAVGNGVGSENVHSRLTSTQHDNRRPSHVPYVVGLWSPGSLTGQTRQ
jgi:hypothetical protein